MTDFEALIERFAHELVIMHFLSDIFTVVDVDQPKPDKKLVMLYVSSLYEALRQYTPVKKAKRRKMVEETMVASNTSTFEVNCACYMFHLKPHEETIRAILVTVVYS